ncbi:RICIN domain-containing protein [Streptomyces sp. CWNU-52B]|uniref:RICIN domain-containing protein n=1 Tax=unclassified Streptomyces TaxID=2593676 RepID=UPI0039C3B64B
MSDQQQATGESSAREAAATSPDAESVEAQLTGSGKPRTASEPKGADAGKAAASRSAADDGAESGDGDTAGTGAASEKAAKETQGAEGDKAENGNAEAAAGKAEPESGAGPEASATGTAAAAAGENGASPSEPPPTPPAEGAAEGNSARALSAAATREQHEAIAVAAAGKGSATSTRTAVGRPRKPVLAGAALAGALLVAVPLLITVTDKDDDKKNVDNASADTVLNSATDPADVFATQAPSPTKTEPEKKKEKKAVAAPPVAEEAVAPAPKPSPSPSKKKKAAVAKKATSTLPAVLTRVLIKNNTNHTCVDIPGFSSGRQDGPITHATCNSNTDDNQLWNVEKRYATAGPGGVPLFQIRNVMDSMCLDLPGYKGVGGATKVTEFPCNGTTADNQLWWLDKQSDGRFWIRNAASNNQCLDSYGNDDATRDLIIWPCAPEGQNNHEWIFTRS